MHGVHECQLCCPDSPRVALHSKRVSFCVPVSVSVCVCAQANGLGWYPEFNKVWEWFGMPGYSW